MALVSSDQFALYRPTDASNRKTSLDDITSFIQATTASNLQEVTDNGSDTTNTILINKSDGADNALTIQGAGVETASISGSGNTAFAGNGTFGGTIQVAGNPVDGAATGVQVRSSGDVRASSASGTAKLWQGYTTGSAAGTSWITADGSFQFAAGSPCIIGTFDFAGTDTCGFYFNQFGNTAAQAVDGDTTRNLWQGFLGDMRTSSITSDGSALFGSDLAVGADPDWADQESNGIAAYVSAPTKWFGIKNSASASATNNAFQVTYGTTNTAVINTDGSATFAGTTMAQNATDATSSELRSNGFVKVVTNTNAGGTKVWGHKYSAAYNSQIFADGSAEFVGIIQTGGNAENGGAQGARLCSYGAVDVTRTNASDYVWAGYTEGSSAPTSSITADGSCWFSGTVTGGTIANTVPLDSWSAIPLLT